MKIAGYVRVSSREQAENSHALEQQIERLKQAGATEIYCDVESGTKDDRKQLLKLLELVRRGEVQEVLITRIDRLTRSLRTILEIRDTFIDCKVKLRALDDSIDLNTVAGRFHLSLLASLAEAEVERLTERVKHGWQHMRASKRVAIAPWGYKVVNGKLELDRSPFLSLLETKQTLSSVDLALDMISMFFEKKALRGAIREFNTKYGIRRFNRSVADKRSGRATWHTLSWSHTGLHGWITNPTLLGHTYYPLKRGKRTKPEDWEIHYNTHEPLITVEQRIEIDKILKRNKVSRGFSSTRLKHPMAGLVYCAECRGSCYSCAGNRGKTPGYNYYFQCKNYRIGACSNKKTIRVEKIDEAIISALTLRNEELSDLAKPTPEIIPTHTKEIELLQQQLQGLESLGFNPAFEQAKKDIKNQIANLEFQGSLKQSSKIEADEKSSLLQYIFSLPDFWNSVSTEDLTKIYHELVAYVWTRDGKVEKVDLKI